MGWNSMEEYVRYMVGHVGYRATADALKTDATSLRERYPGLASDETEYSYPSEHACTAASVRKHRPRNKPKFADVTLRCARCGRAVVRTSANQRYCHDCGKRRRIEMSVEYNRRLRAKKHKEPRRADSSPDAGETENYPSLRFAGVLVVFPRPWRTFPKELVTDAR